MTEEKPNPFNIIKHRGEPNKAEFEGIPITRQDKLFIDEWGALISCAHYDNHFIFEIPTKRKRIGISEYMCTCGSAAVVANPENAMARMFVCLFHIEFGYHQTSVVNKRGFESIAGQTLAPKAKKWLI